MAAEGHPFTGFLYAGLMIDEFDTPRVLEYNVRFGDPETQPIMLRLRSDLVELCQAALAGRLDKVNADWDPRTSLGVVLAAGGYPGSYRKGDVITGIPAETDTTKVFHAGTAEKHGDIVTSGGRVLCACALGNSVREAQQVAYELVQQIQWEGMYFRTDIGHRAIAREKIR
jgi:phosphoribosylamine--glycine ligase